MKEFKVIEIYDTTMQVTNQKVAVIILGEIEYVPFGNSGYSSIRVGEHKKFLIDLNSTMFPQILEKARNDEYITLERSDFRIRDEVRNGIVEEISYHKNVYLIGIDKEDDFIKFYKET